MRSLLKWERLGPAAAQHWQDGDTIMCTAVGKLCDDDAVWVRWVDDDGRATEQTPIFACARHGAGAPREPS